MAEIRSPKAFCFVLAILVLIPFIVFAVIAIPDISRVESYKKGSCLSKVFSNTTEACSERSSCKSRRYCSALDCGTFPLTTPGIFFCCDESGYACQVTVGVCNVYTFETKFESLSLGIMTYMCPLSNPFCVSNTYATTCWHSEKQDSLVFEKPILSKDAEDMTYFFAIWDGMLVGSLFMTLFLFMCMALFKRCICRSSFEFTDPTHENASTNV